MPAASGELALIDVRGDDRMRVAGRRRSALGPNGSSRLMLTRERLLVWDVESGRLERNIPLPEPFVEPWSVRVSPNGRWVGVSGEVPTDSRTRVGATRILDLSADEDVAWTSVVPGAGPVRFFDDAATARVGEFRLDLARGTTVEDSDWSPEDLEFSDGRRVLVRADPMPGQPSMAEGSWDLRDRDGRSLHRFPAAAVSAVSGDGRRVAFLDASSGRVHIYDTQSKERVATLDAYTAGRVALSVDGSKLLLNSVRCFEPASNSSAPEPAVRGDLGCVSPHFALYDVQTGREIWHRDEQAGRRWIFSETGQYLTGPHGRVVDYLLRVEDGERILLHDRQGPIPVVALSHDDSMALFGDGSIVALDDFEPRERPIATKVLALSPEGRARVEYASTRSETQIRLVDGERCTVLQWNPARLARFGFAGPEVLVMVDRHERGLLVRGLDEATGVARYAIDVASEGDVRVGLAGQRVFVQGADNPRVERFDARRGERLPVAQAPTRRPSTVGPYVFEILQRPGARVSRFDEEVVVTAKRHLLTTESFDERWHVSLWDLEDPEGTVDRTVPARPVEVAAVEGSSPIWAIGDDKGGLYIIRGGRMIIAGSRDNHDRRVTALAFGPDGSRLFSAAEDGTILVTDTVTSRTIGRAQLPLDYATHLAFDAPRGQLVVETARGQRVRFAWG